MARSFIRTTTTVIGLMLLAFAARGWMKPGDPLPGQEAGGGDTTLRARQSWEHTIDASARSTADASLALAELGSVHHEDLHGPEVGSVGTGQSASHPRWFLDDPELLVPAYAVRGRARWCNAPDEFVFCNHWTPTPYDTPSRPGPASTWRMCSCAMW